MRQKPQIAWPQTSLLPQAKGASVYAQNRRAEPPPKRGGHRRRHPRHLDVQAFGKAETLPANAMEGMRGCEPPATAPCIAEKVFPHPSKWTRPLLCRPEWPQTSARPPRIERTQMPYGQARGCYMLRLAHGTMGEMTRSRSRRLSIS